MDVRDARRQWGACRRVVGSVGESVAALVFAGAPHAWYFDETAGDLRHAWWVAGAGAWSFETLDGLGGANGRTTNRVGSFAAAGLHDGSPHAWYFDETAGDLRHAWWIAGAGAWSFETLDGLGGANGRTTNRVGEYTAIAFYQGAPHAWYFDETAGDLRHAWWVAGAGAWSFATLDGLGGANGRTTNRVGEYTAIAFYQGAPHAWYFDETAGDLRHAWWVAGAGAWSFETLDGLGGANGRTTNRVGEYTAIAFYQGAPHAWYFDETAGDLRHAWWVAGAGAWSFETLDGLGGANGRTTNRVGSFAAADLHDGSPHAWYFDETAGDLRHAWWIAGAGAWSFETLDGHGGRSGRTINTVGLFSVVSDYQGVPHVWYQDRTDGDLRHGWFS